jgi:hypothetical protein
MRRWDLIHNLGYRPTVLPKRYGNKKPAGWGEQTVGVFEFCMVEKSEKYQNSKFNALAIIFERNPQMRVHR